MERVRPMQSAGVERQKTTKTTWLANLPLCGWAVSVALGCLHYYFDVFAPYREINGFPKDRVEDYCLWVSAALSTAAIVIGLFVLLSIRRSGGQLAGKYRVIVGIAFNVVSLPVTLVMIWARALVNSTV